MTDTQDTNLPKMEGGLEDVKQTVEIPAEAPVEAQEPAVVEEAVAEEETPIEEGPVEDDAPAEEVTNEEDKRSTFISKLVQKAETTGIVEQYPIKKKDSNAVITKKNLMNDNSITLNVMKYTEDEIILKRDIAIKSLLSSSNISASEISKLNIFDFLHTRIIIQSQNCRSLMRVILISNDTRNAIYDYLKTRKDSDEYLFESVYGEHTIEEREVFDISRK